MARTSVSSCDHVLENADLYLVHLILFMSNSIIILVKQREQQNKQQQNKLTYGAVDAVFFVLFLFSNYKDTKQALGYSQCESIEKIKQQKRGSR